MQKPIKGNGLKSFKEKKCKNCKEMFTPERPIQPVCNYKCAIEWNKKLATKKEKQDWQKEKKVLKEKLKTLGQYELEARKEFQKWIRERDKDLPCISCGCITAKQWDGGHYLKAELFSGLIFNENNVHKQCSTCNDYKSGNELEYRDGLIKRFGIKFVEDLEATKNQFRNYKYTKQELVEIKNKYKQRLK